MTYTNFAPDKPEYLKSDKFKGDCIQYTSGNYTIKTQWINKDCNSADKKALCQKPAKDTPPPDIPDIPIDPNVEENERFCGHSTWRHFREDPDKPGKCYYFGTPLSSFKGKSLHTGYHITELLELRSKCGDMNSNPVSINSPDENKYIMDTLSVTALVSKILEVDPFQNRPPQPDRLFANSRP